MQFPAWCLGDHAPRPRCLAGDRRVGKELQSWGAVEIADLEIRHELQEVEVLGTLYSRDPITETQLDELQRELDAQLRPDVSLRLIVIPAVLLESGTS